MIETLRDGTVPIYLARATGGRPPKWLDDWYMERFVDWLETGRAKEGVVCRGVALEKLPYVLEHGIDVPVGNPLWVDVALDKAWEYGGSAKLLMVLSNDALQTSHFVLPIDTPDEQPEVYKKEYRTVVRLEDKGQIYLSRLDARDPRIGSDYEWAYCRFPVGDPTRLSRCAGCCSAARRTPRADSRTTRIALSLGKVQEDGAGS
jgi:hypothetical protein